MRLPLLTALICIGGPISAHAQLTVRVAAGATLGTSLVSEAILYEDVVSLKTGIAPSLVVTLGYPIAPTYRLLVEGRFASSTLTGSGDAGSSDLGALRTIEFAVLADGPLPYHMRFQLGGGAIKYSPAEAGGVFLADAPIKPMVAGGISWMRTLSPSLALHVGGRWTLHEFTTKTLEQRGYSLAQRIHRIGLTIGMERTF